MTLLITSYWGDSTTEDLRLRRQYEIARDSLVPRFNRLAHGSLEVYDLDWLQNQNVEHFLIRGTGAEAPMTNDKLDSLVNLLIRDRQRDSIGTGVAIYGLHASASARDLRRKTDPVRPRGLRFVAHESSVDNFGSHLTEWMTQAATEVIARASVTPSEHLIQNLSAGQPSTVRSDSWDMI